MLILLPPSETKSAPSSGNPVDVTTLSWPQLRPQRERALKALMKVSAQKNALEALGVGASLASEVQRNTTLLEAPAAPALEVYTGVLFDALDPGSFTVAQRTVADEVLVVISALWGAVKAADQIPAYRLSGATALRGLGRSGGLKMSTYWKPHLNRHLCPEAQGQVVVDCRSATYAAAFQPAPENTVTIKVVQMVKGQRKVVSHNAKHTRGLVARFLVDQLANGAVLNTVQAVADAVCQQWVVELTAPTSKKPGELTLILPEQE